MPFDILLVLLRLILLKSKELSASGTEQCSCPAQRCQRRLIKGAEAPSRAQDDVRRAESMGGTSQSVEENFSGCPDCLRVDACESLLWCRF